MQIDEVLVPTANVDLVVIVLLDSDEILLYLISIVPPDLQRLTYRMCVIAQMLLH